MYTMTKIRTQYEDITQSAEEPRNDHEIESKRAYTKSTGNLAKKTTTIDFRNTYYNVDDGTEDSETNELEKTANNIIERDGTTHRISDEALKGDYDSFLESIKVRHSAKEKGCTWNKRDQNEPLGKCTFSSIQKYMDMCGYFPNQLTLDPVLQPKYRYCEIQELPKDEILDYFHENVSRVVTFGDSQGAMYSGAILANFQLRGIRCHVVKAEPQGFQSKKTYFFNDSRVIEVLLDANRTCRTCSSFLRECIVPPTNKFKTPKTIEFEYIGLILNKLDTVMVNKEYCDTHQDRFECQQLKTLSDVVFRYYLRGAKSDLMFMFPTFAHDVRVPFRQIVPKLEALFEMLNQTLAGRTSIVWIPSTTANYNAFPFDSRDNGTGLSHRTEQLNHWLFELLQRFSGAKRFHGFFDVGEIGRIQEHQWATDFIHFDHIFYQTVMGIVFNLLPSL